MDRDRNLLEESDVYIKKVIQSLASLKAMINARIVKKTIAFRILNNTP